jgi:hypothetical protein
MRTDLSLGQITQREERLREKNVKCHKSKFIRVCLKKSFYREKKDLEIFFCVFLLTDLPLGKITQREGGRYNRTSY